MAAEITEKTEIPVEFGTVAQEHQAPTFAGIMEEHFARELCSAVRAWLDAGKPHKR